MLDHDLTVNALCELQAAYSDLRTFFRERGIENFGDDICRRNIMMSAFHEHFFTNAFSDQYGGARNDGRTGEADIIITPLNREVECKLTSISSSGTFSMQTDYKTLQRKGTLDYLYVLTNRKFDEFSVLYFEGLTPDDFHMPSKSSRGKAKMKKHIAFSKLNVLYGDISNRTNANLVKAKRNLAKCSLRAKSRREKLIKSIEYWENSDASFRIITYPVIKEATQIAS